MIKPNVNQRRFLKWVLNKKPYLLSYKLRTRISNVYNNDYYEDIDRRILNHLRSLFLDEYKMNLRK